MSKETEPTSPPDASVEDVFMQIEEGAKPPADPPKTQL